MNILEVQNLCKTYGKGEAAVQALRDVTFSVHKGEFVAIVGESGSGKSTLLNVVGALDKPTAGKVLIDAEKVNGVWEQRLRIHYNCVGTIEIPSALPLPTPDVSVNTRKGVVVNYAPCDVAI